MTFFERTQILAADSGSIDAFGRWRVSQPVTLFDGKVGVSDAVLFTNFSNNGTITYSTSNLSAEATLTVNAGVNGGCVRQTYKRFPYFPGKSQLVLVTFVFGAATGSITRQVGYYDDNNGIFLQQNGSEVSIIKRSNASGNIVDTKVLQSDWNIDTFDGTGPSGLTLNLAMSQILVIDLEWLGVGRVRVGFNVDGVTYYVHEFLHANRTAGVYMGTATLPVRYMITNSGLGTQATLRAICCTVMAEGGTDPIGVPAGIAVGSAVSITTGNTYAALGLRLSTTGRATAYPTSFSVIGTSVNDYFRWSIWRDPTIAGSPAWTAHPNSDVEVTTGNASTTINTLTGRVLATGVALSQQNVSINALDAIQLELGYGASPVQVPLVLAIEPYSNMNYTAALNWREIL